VQRLVKRGDHGCEEVMGSSDVPLLGRHGGFDFVKPSLYAMYCCAEFSSFVAVSPRATLEEQSGINRPSAV